MKTSIRILALALVVLMGMAVMAGCGGKAEEAAATEADYDVTVFPYEMLVGMHIAVSYDDFLAA